MLTKTCSKCQQPLSLESFYPAPKNRDGLRGVCKRCCNTRSRAYYENNTEAMQSAIRTWKQANPDKKLASNTAWRKAHPEAYRGYYRKYKSNNPDKVLKWNHDYRARKAGAVGSFSEQEWLTLLLCTGGACNSCGEVVKMTVDHVVPLYMGGSNTIDNIQPLCGSCNSSKGYKVQVLTKYPGR